MAHGVIYKISNSINDKVYYGQTKSSPPSHRWNRHKYSAKNHCKTPIHCAMRKHGIENFKFEIICSCDTLEELNEKEIEIIFNSNSFCPKGYNVMKGGDNFERTEEHKKKIGDSLRGKKKTAEHVENMKISKKGIGLGIPKSEEHKQKISKAHLGKKKPQTKEHIETRALLQRGTKRTPETIEKMKIARKEWWVRKKFSENLE